MKVGSLTMPVLNAWSDELIVRTKHTHPYSYEPFTLYGGRADITDTQNAYSDRLFQWDSDKFNKACIEVWGNKGQRFDNRTSSEIEQFLRIYTGNGKLKLVWVVQECNVSNGYPVWYFQWKNK